MDHRGIRARWAAGIFPPAVYRDGLPGPADRYDPARAATGLRALATDPGLVRAAARRQLPGVHAADPQQADPGHRMGARSAHELTS
ncbi:hypothetical protein [Streptomyces sp. NPDC102283]|uniref:hypothetical protein n=1 Tax=Streptomyces sp. NPDC102283 TaxID=3366155 RepID=UPI00381ABA6E